MSARAAGETGTPGGARRQVLDRIADHLAATRPDGHPLRLAVDGITAAGKTTFADEIVAALRGRGVPTVRVSMDGFHHPRAHRYQRGRGSAEGYYLDAYDFPSFRRLVLAPLGPGGDGAYRDRILDLASDTSVDAPAVVAEPDAVLVVDGSFLQREELAGGWDQVLYVDTDVEVARERGVRRDSDALGGPVATDDAYRQRYHAACRRYVTEVGPADRADILVANSDVDHPVLRRIGGAAGSTAHLFSYGTLQQPDMPAPRRSGAELEGRPDRLGGHRTEWVAITDPHVVAVSGTDRHPIVRS